jgi:hypothetical protein
VVIPQAKQLHGKDGLSGSILCNARLACLLSTIHNATPVLLCPGGFAAAELAAAEKITCMPCLNVRNMCCMFLFCLHHCSCKPGMTVIPMFCCVLAGLQLQARQQLGDASSQELASARLRLLALLTVVSFLLCWLCSCKLGSSWVKQACRSWSWPQ